MSQKNALYTALIVAGGIVLYHKYGKAGLGMRRGS